jgi:hypothetical protein
LIRHGAWGRKMEGRRRAGVKVFMWDPL